MEECTRGSTAVVTPFAYSETFEGENAEEGDEGDGEEEQVAAPEGAHRSVQEESILRFDHLATLQLHP